MWGPRQVSVFLLEACCGADDGRILGEIMDALNCYTALELNKTGLLELCLQNKMPDRMVKVR